MSVDPSPARLAKWPFYLADLLLSAVIGYVLYGLGSFEGTTDMVIVSACLAAASVAAWISVVPWLKEHQATIRLSETSNLKSSLEQIKAVEKVAELIKQSNTQWQGVQDTSARTVSAAREITEKMKVEADEFMKFMATAHDQERAGLRLEVEKLRRMEGDWIIVSVQILDHIYAIYRAAERSGQQHLIGQLTQFQGACREAARRMGLAAFAPIHGEVFDPRAHQLPDPKMKAPDGAAIQEVLATGYTYQGQLLRRALVLVEKPGESASSEGAEDLAPAEDAGEIAAAQTVENVEAAPQVEGERETESTQEAKEILPDSVVADNPIAHSGAEPFDDLRDNPGIDDRGEEFGQAEPVASGPMPGRTPTEAAVVEPAQPDAPKKSRRLPRRSPQEELPL